MLSSLVDAKRAFFSSLTYSGFSFEFNTGKRVGARRHRYLGLRLIVLVYVADEFFN